MDYCNVLAGMAADLVGVPALIQGGRSVAPDNFLIFQPYMRPGYRAIFANRETILLNNSRAGAADYARWLGVGLDRIRVIPNGFEFPSKPGPEQRRDERQRLGISPERFVIGSIIRFSEEKRPKLLIDTARRLLDRRPDLRFVFFGEGPMLKDMHDCVHKCGLSETIRLPGYTRDAWRSLAAMDLFVLTSRMEGLPNVVVEAQAMGLPVVCTTVGGTIETFCEGKTGYGVSVATPEALADAISPLLDDPKLYARMSEAAFRHARDSFAIERMIAAMRDAYRDAEAKAASSTHAVRENVQR
jgi:glycosyltransferase involved in cell wall biosynthesis